VIISRVPAVKRRPKFVTGALPEGEAVGLALAPAEAAGLGLCPVFPPHETARSMIARAATDRIGGTTVKPKPL
jgi:hypothetical protein